MTPPSRPRRGLDADAGAWHQAEMAVGHDGVTGHESLLDQGLGADVPRNGDRPHFDGLICLDDEDVEAIGPGLHGD